ncbi:hypothetical protein RRG08_060145 [Elysia crispata]|uniref:Uncharacterized protein n=1 Tax=Elysia crispata TaxID=231223 RepID=A0AAE0ZZL0_9GAST|nr:hypothetical protein RRG08_060145 [Elysia crispata]
MSAHPIALDVGNRLARGWHLERDGSGDSRVRGDRRRPERDPPHKQPSIFVVFLQRNKAFHFLKWALSRSSYMLAHRLRFLYRLAEVAQREARRGGREINDRVFFRNSTRQ